MENVKRLLDEAKAKTGSANLNQLSKSLGISSQRMSDYYNGTRTPDNDVCLTIAECIGKPLDEVIVAVSIDAAKDETSREAWKRYSKRLGGLAASFMIIALSAITFVTLFVTSDAKAQERQGLQTNQNHAIQIMRY